MKRGLRVAKRERKASDATTVRVNAGPNRTRPALVPRPEDLITENRYSAGAALLFRSGSPKSKEMIKYG